MSGLIGQTYWDVRVRVRVRVRTLLCYCFLLNAKFELISKTSVKVVRRTVFKLTGHAKALMCQD